MREGVDFTDVFASTVRLTTLRIMLSIAAQEDLELQQMDVSYAFLNGRIDEEIYMRRPEGSVLPGQEHLVCELKKALYGTKQAARQWYR